MGRITAIPKRNRTVRRRSGPSLPDRGERPSTGEAHLQHRNETARGQLRLWPLRHGRFPGGCERRDETRRRARQLVETFGMYVGAVDYAGTSSMTLPRRTGSFRALARSSTQQVRQTLRTIAPRGCGDGFGYSPVQTTRVGAPSTRPRTACSSCFPCDDAPFDSGEGGIRTRGTLAGTHDFQSCTFGHSVTSPGARVPRIHSTSMPDKTAAATWLEGWKARSQHRLDEPTGAEIPRVGHNGKPCTLLATKTRVKMADLT